MRVLRNFRLHHPYDPYHTAGLMDALKIAKADVIGYSLGSYIAQQLTIMYPDKVNSLVLVGSSRGGKDHKPKPSGFIKLQSKVVNQEIYQDVLSETFIYV